MVKELGVSERRACRVLGQYRSTQRKVPTTPDDEAALIADIIELVRQFGRFGYRRITKMLKTAGWTVNHKRVERIWRREGLGVSELVIIRLRKKEVSPLRSKKGHGRRDRREVAAG